MVVPDIEVANVSPAAVRIDMLPGRNVLALCDFNNLGRAGTFSLTY